MELIESKEEKWKKVDGYENYSVSTMGNVRNDETMRIFKGSKDKNGYLIGNLTKNRKSKSHSIHRLVALAFIPNPDVKPCVDHVFNNKIDNRVEVLRWCTHEENNRNQQISSNNTSGFKGVSWHKSSQKWQANIKIDGISIHLGLFETKEEAATARRTRANEAFGVFTNLCENLPPHH